jgi:hypothetical protein
MDLYGFFIPLYFALHVVLLWSNGESWIYSISLLASQYSVDSSCQFCQCCCSFSTTQEVRTAFGMLRTRATLPPFTVHVSGAICTHPQEHTLQGTAIGMCNGYGMLIHWSRYCKGVPATPTPVD